ncbi:hypothetical protein L2E82_23117 [Cichorium intybus]|uniref:Uncharacterized protein n=1 Tax=Cichorium intybus TaxID=13427 RepID=A0ACB9DZ83_CICIN|nr:hypothetical protein L2E82_23117 [Cichorium intybus]
MDRRHKPHQRRRLEAVDRTSHRKTYRHLLLVASPEHLPIAHTLPSDAREGWSKLVSCRRQPASVSIPRLSILDFRFPVEKTKTQSVEEKTKTQSDPISLSLLATLLS